MHPIPYVVLILIRRARLAYTVPNTRLIVSPLAVDDGSGCVPCLLWLKDLREDGTSFAGLRTDEIVLGRMLRVRGRPVIYRGNPQVHEKLSNG